jgi:protein-tyrosine-phosphatase/DNA-binding transcriptional ArsR family regulator
MYPRVVGSPSQAAPGFARLAGHPLRWRLLTELAHSDLRVRELVALVDQPQNLVSYHLRLLRDAGLVTANRSSFDGRDSYYHLDLDRCGQALAATAAALHPALHLIPASPAIRPAAPARVLFVCTGNSARSPIAEALLRHHTNAQVEATSAGTRPKPRLHPHAVRALRERYGIDLTGQRPRHLDGLTGRRFDYVISVCDKARERCGVFGEQTRRMHWSVPDPAADSSTASYPSFLRTADNIDTRIRHLLPILASSNPKKV